jgi:polyisoprenyl-phosphate glycosyltransferase
MSDVAISVVSPVYRSEELVPELVSQLLAELSALSLTFEIILVDDRSPDLSWIAIQAACAAHPEVVGIRLSRNFGQHYAISAGIQRAKGEWVVVMDCDLQDRPDQISKLLAEARNGFDVVLARRVNRNDSWQKKFLSRIFYRFLGYLTGVPQDASVANFGIYNRKVIATINAMRESIRYFPTMVSFVGFRSTKINIEHSKRPSGSSSYTLSKLIKLATDICLASSDKPLRLAVKSGLLISGLGFAYALYILVRAIQGTILLAGYASIVVSLWMLSGFIISIIGLVGLYVGKSFESSKNRPIFIIDEIVNGSD